LLKAFTHKFSADFFQSKALPTKKTSIFAYSSLVVPPNSTFAFVWRTIKAFLVTYTMLIVPYRYSMWIKVWYWFWNRVSFDDFADGLIVTDYAMDTFFLLDIILNFFFAFNRRTKVIKDFKSIAIHYIMYYPLLLWNLEWLF
jgi:hypothetical protein